VKLIIGEGYAGEVARVNEGPKYELSGLNEGLILIICSGIVKSVIIQLHSTYGCHMTVISML